MDEPEDVTQSEINQSQKDKYSVIPPRAPKLLETEGGWWLLGAERRGMGS